MSAGTTQTGAPAATGGTGANQWLTAVALATFMELLDTTIANVALRLQRLDLPLRQREGCLPHCPQ